MGNTTLGRCWEGLGACVRGASHIRSGQPNQDALSWVFRDSDADFTGVLAVADGHGSARSFRSELGAKFAVRIATEVLEEFADGFREHKNLTAIGRAAELDLPKRIVHLWQESVGEHFKKQPFAGEELACLDAAGRKAVEEQPPLTYGTTLVAVLVTDRFILYLQVGDGDIVVVSDDGRVIRPLPRDERLLANETTSLCSLGSEEELRRSPASPTGAWSEFRTRLDPGMETPPALILASTDGYANSFRSDADFLKVGSDLLEILRDEGLDHVKDHLETWLVEASQAGSGDDVTLGMICRRNAVRRSLSATQTGAADSPPAVPGNNSPGSENTAGQESPPRRSWYRLWRK